MSWRPSTLDSTVMNLPEHVPVFVRSVRRRSDAVIARRRALVGGDKRPPRGPQRLVDVERAAVAPSTLLGCRGCGIPSVGAASVQEDLSVPADFVEASQDILEHHELRGDDDEIESVQSNLPDDSARREPAGVEEDHRSPDSIPQHPT